MKVLVLLLVLVPSLALADPAKAPPVKVHSTVKLIEPGVSVGDFISRLKATKKAAPPPAVVPAIPRPELPVVESEAAKKAAKLEAKRLEREVKQAAKKAKREAKKAAKKAKPKG